MKKQRYEAIKTLIDKYISDEKQLNDSIIANAIQEEQYVGENMYKSKIDYKNNKPVFCYDNPYYDLDFEYEEKLLDKK